jgi:hypothetical protein
MADVFLSYAREDSARAEQIARGLEAAGIDVFWDNEIPPGQTWADYIEQKLTQCKALIVLWSEHSTKSQWVREEARMGRDKGCLIPVMIDASTPPFGFGEVQAANLSSWNGEADHPGWRRFVDAVRHFAQGASQPAPQPAMSAPPRDAAPRPAPTPQPHASAEPKKGVPVWVWVVGAVVATIVVLGIIGSMMPQDQTQVAGPPVQPAQGAAQPAPVQGAGQNAYQQQILERLAQVEQAFVAQGFQQMAPPITGQLPAGQYHQYPMTLNVGGDYRIIGVCDNDCSNFDLALYDQNNNLISQDVLTDATPIVSVAPQWTGPFQVQAGMQACSVQPCYYALVLYGRPTQ